MSTVASMPLRSTPHWSWSARDSIYAAPIQWSRRQRGAWFHSVCQNSTFTPKYSSRRRTRAIKAWALARSRSSDRAFRSSGVPRTAHCSNARSDWAYALQAAVGSGSARVAQCACWLEAQGSSLVQSRKIPARCSRAERSHAAISFSISRRMFALSDVPQATAPLFGWLYCRGAAMLCWNAVASRPSDRPLKMWKVDSRAQASEKRCRYRPPMTTMAFRG